MLAMKLNAKDDREKVWCQTTKAWVQFMTYTNEQHFSKNLSHSKRAISLPIRPLSFGWLAKGKSFACLEVLKRAYSEALTFLVVPTVLVYVCLEGLYTTNTELL